MGVNKKLILLTPICFMILTYMICNHNYLFTDILKKNTKNIIFDLIKFYIIILY